MDQQRHRHGDARAARDELTGPPVPELRFTLLGPDGPYRSETPGGLGGHRRTRIYGRLDCPTALRHIARGQYVAHRVFFRDEQTAVACGYRPCGSCMREEYAVWKAGQADSS